MNFEEWGKTAVSSFTAEFGRDGIRDVYTFPSNIKIYHEVFLPRNIFRKQTLQVLIDVIYHKNCLKFFKEFNLNEKEVYFDEDRYTEENFGYLVFTNVHNSNFDVLRKAFDFCESGKAKKLLEKTKF